MADILTADEVTAPGDASAFGERVARRSDYEGTMTTLTKSLVKGVGHITNDGRPLSDGVHSTQILSKSHQAILDTRAAAFDGRWNSSGTAARINPELWRQAPQQYKGLGMQLVNDAETRKAMDATTGKSFTAGNLGLNGAPYGLVPFDLLAPSRLIYPVYTLFRNKFPRPAGQGASRQVYGLLGVSGSQTGGQGIVDISIPELVQSGGTMAANQWPMNLPGSGKQTEYKLNVPYRFFGLTESLSWLGSVRRSGIRGHFRSC